MLRVAGRRLSSLSWRSGHASQASFTPINPLAAVDSPDMSLFHVNSFPNQIRAVMKTFTSSSTAARLSKSVDPRTLIAPNGNKISIPNSLSAAFLSRVASPSVLSRPHSTAATTSKIPATKGTKIVDRSPNWAAMIARAPKRTLWHVYEGIDEILMDYVHQETTRTLVLVLFKLLFIVALKDVFLALARF